MKPSSLLFLQLLLLHLSITNPQSLINSTCKAFAQNDPNINYDFCTTSLQSSPAAQCANLRELGAVSIRLISNNITDTICYIEQQIRNKSEPYLNQCLIDCFELYSDAIPTVNQAMRDYNGERFDDANIEISSVMDAATTCEDGFEERRGVNSPLRKRNDDLFQLSAIALSIMGLIQNGNG